MDGWCHGDSCASGLYNEQNADFANFIPAPGFTMAQYVSHGLIDPGSPPSDASDYSQDTVEDLNLYNNLVCRARIKTGMSGADN